MYTETHLESWITNTYQDIKIFKPQGIKPKRLCRWFDIFLLSKDIPSHSVEHGRFKSITIDYRLSKEEQHEEFFHEFCHLLRHTGRQYMMPKAFIELQEHQANAFTMYATLPYYMLQNYDLNESDIVYTLAETFTVTESLVVRRLEQIRNRIIVNTQSKELNTNENSTLCSSQYR